MTDIVEAPQRPAHASRVLLLAVAGLVVYSLAALPISQPATMDSHYYYGGGRSLQEYRAFVEPYIWNYLDDPPDLPAPSHLYWMPLPSLLVAAAQWLLGPSFGAAQIPFVLLAAGLPLISYATSWELGHNRRHAVTAGLLTVFSGFYVPYWTVPETFAPFAVIGGLTLYGIGRFLEHRRGLWLLGAGVLAGLGHLCRADGALLLGIGILCVLAAGRRHRARAVLSAAVLLFGYSIVMVPWFARNWLTIGAPLSTAGTKTIFLTDYDELFSYGTPLTWERYLAWGWQEILRSKVAAAWSNLQTFVAVDSLVFLTPLCLFGAWQMRRRRFVWPALAYCVALYGVMTVLFTFPGARGGVFHSSVALLPAICATSMVGLDTAVDWIARRRRAWNRRVARRFLGVGLVLLAAGMSAYIYSQRVIGNGTWAEPAWNEADVVLAQVGEWLQAQGEGEPIVMVGNPPALTYHSGLPAIAVPNEGVERTLAAARRYGADYIVLDHNRPEPLSALYEGREKDPGLQLVWNAEMGAPAGVAVFRVSGGE
jgi:4-amino-4-deoxy-L-arabinose transferase-like glycosyltransferase